MDRAGEPPESPRPRAVVRFVDTLPPRTNGDRPRVRHDLIALALRGSPGRWALLADVPPKAIGGIRGTLSAYRPSGSFEAVTRGDVVYARYVGWQP